MTIKELYIKTKPANIKKEFALIIGRLLKSNQVKELAADLNRVRLNETGKDIYGNDMRTYKASNGRPYTLRTIILKEAKGQETGHFTGKDKGNLHNSIKAVNTNKTIKIVADGQRMIKLSENINTDDMLGFTDEDESIIIEEIRPEIFNEIISYLQ